MIWIDSSALLAVLDRDDRFHERAHAVWSELVEHDALMFTSNYCLVETSAIAQSRLGLAAVRSLNTDVLPVLSVDFVDEQIHTSAVGSMLTAGRKALSLVDCVSFEIMRRRGISQVFTFDRHFREQGFAVVPK